MVRSGMAGKLIEFPRHLEWQPVEIWTGKVRGTQLWAEVRPAAEGFSWIAGNGGLPLAHGTAPTEAEGKSFALRALTEGAVVIRPLDGAGAPGYPMTML